MGLVISTLILGAAAAVFVTAMDSWRRGGRARRTLQASQTLSHTVERYLRSAVPPDVNANIMLMGTDLTTGDAAGHEITFMSTSSSRFPRSAARTDVNEVTIRFDPEDGRGLTLRVDPTPDDVPDDGGYEVALYDHVAGFEIQYYDGAEWAPEWARNAAPQAFQFTITLKEVDDGGIETGGLYEVKRLVWTPRAKEDFTAALAGESSVGTMGAP